MEELDDWKKEDQTGSTLFILFAALHAPYGRVARGSWALFNRHPDGWTNHFA